MDGENGAIGTQSCSGEHVAERPSGKINCLKKEMSKGLRFIKKCIGELHVWNEVVVILCVAAILLDPLFCYILVVDEKKNCIEFDQNLRITAIVLRSLIDFGYILIIAFHFRMGYTGPYDAKKETLYKIGRRYLLSYFTVDILAVLPLPQVVNLLVIPAAKGSHFSMALRSLQFVLIIQHLPRALRIYKFLKKVRLSSSLFPNSTGGNAMFNLFLYMLSSHAFGAFWYLFAIERKASCLQKRCGADPYCPRMHNLSSVERSCIKDCSANASSNDKTAFNFGIFDDALTSGVVYSTDLICKLCYCCWWGLQNLSSLGQGLKTSQHIWEIFFAVSITIAGLVLFALLIGNLQTFLQANIARLEELRLKVEDIELWTPFHFLPRKLRKQIKKCEMRKLRQTRSDDVANILRNLPTDLRSSTVKHLCSPAFNNVSMFQILNGQQLNEKLIDAVCGYLKPVEYTERNIIVEKGKPLDKMIFVIHGKLWMYSNDNREDGTIGSSESLTKDNYFGEDLLNWGLKDPLLSTVPLSPKTVSAHTKVEAFVLSANDLKIFISKFWWLISSELSNHPKFKEQCKKWAVPLICAAWYRYKKNKQRRSKIESGSSQPSGTTGIAHAKRFIRSAWHALYQRRRRISGSNDRPGHSNNTNGLP
ncbi:cyclic nucleotide-gated ion channel 1-like [Cucurbita moschata]|uniref:Cyclic nucleotide-gated ion channel 1-like n=1 Tax=Cucurbita moschata TaxID=3662 RepID=A0A6J1E924_CUCMO|nr:cyclic nucleotide-gated ion channel 1-like [Cucurbita moschata]XP_022922542.1 cyclic nucleotide-gated ion channel 1-like [Cucurbita moschata]